MAPEICFFFYFMVSEIIRLCHQSGDSKSDVSVTRKEQCDNIWERLRVQSLL